MHSPSTEWLPIATAPSGRDLEVCVLDFDGIVHALVVPCHREGAAWLDERNGRHPDIQPTHWRGWRGLAS